MPHGNAHHAQACSVASEGAALVLTQQAAHDYHAASTRQLKDSQALNHALRCCPSTSADARLYRLRAGICAVLVVTSASKVHNRAALAAYHQPYEHCPCYIETMIPLRRCTSVATQYIV